MSPEAGQHLDKARDCLARGRIILAAGIGEGGADVPLERASAALDTACPVNRAHRVSNLTGRFRSAVTPGAALFPAAGGADRP